MMQTRTSAIQAGSRLGYQESAELCAQYLAPILDAIKFNFLPFGLNEFFTADTLPKQVTYSEERLRPPAGYKDTTVPGIWSRDTRGAMRKAGPDSGRVRLELAGGVGSVFSRHVRHPLVAVDLLRNVPVGVGPGGRDQPVGLGCPRVVVVVDPGGHGLQIVPEA